MSTISSAAAAASGPARERVYEWLREEILKGTIEQGRFLDEQWVSEAVGVSRTPVREAFHRLEAEHFISLQPRRGAQVRIVTARELEEVYQARELIEGRSIDVICHHRLGAPEGMVNLLEPMEALGSQADWYGLSGLDRRFHRAMVSAAGNSLLAELYDSLRSRQQRVAVRAITARPDRIPHINSEHRALVMALDRNDRDDAVRILRDHLRTLPEVTSRFSES